MLRTTAALLFVLACSCGQVRHLRTDDGLRRDYRVHTPAGWDGESALPVVLVFHGGGGNAEGTQVNVGMDAAADAHGFLAVYPDGVGQKVLGTELNTWNGEYCCGVAQEQGVDDVAYVDQLLDALAARYPIDPARVFATGISNGGIMSHMLACNLPERIAAIAPIASPGPPPSCAADTPVAVQIIHGTDDPCALYDGGDECGGCWSRVIEQVTGREVEDTDLFPCASVPDQVALWRVANGCTEESAVTYQQGAATCVQYSDCASGRPVSLCSIEGGGHSWPGTDLACDPETEWCTAYADVTGSISQDLDANEIMWAFFSENPMPE
ncbi:MAG: polyhydroxybutyrate depolymerase [Alphaproteobacteria bacterium]|nr:polyhydroxybutyrate depolymerase [Alphaproteobacteria bacterium]